jgi:hypothetical protein
MSNVLTETEICNSALIKLGADTVLNLEDGSKGARLCKQQYPIARNEVLRSHYWNFAIKRSTLAQLATAPDFGYDYYYQLPSDFLLAIPPSPHEGLSTIIYKLENGKLASNETEINLKYVAEITDTALFDALFVEVLAAKIAANLAYAMTQNRSVASDMYELYFQLLRQARSANAMESTPELMQANTWINSRFS